MEDKFRLIGSVDITALVDAYNRRHSSVKQIQTKNGPKVVADIVIWINATEPDAYGNIAGCHLQSVQASEIQDKQTFGGKVYIGNWKVGAGSGQPVTGQELNTGNFPGMQPQQQPYQQPVQQPVQQPYQQPQQFNQPYGQPQQFQQQPVQQPVQQPQQGQQQWQPAPGAGIPF